MPKKIAPRIAAGSADEQPMTLLIHWRTGEESTVDVSGLIETFRTYQKLRRSQDLFR